MTARQRKTIKWAAILSAVATLMGIGTALLSGLNGVARAAAAEQFAPVEKRVLLLEEHQKSIDEKLTEIKKDTNCIMNLHMNPPQPCVR